MSSGAIYVENTQNQKLSKNDKVDCTYVAIESTCPKSCAFKNNGCYALNSYVGIVVSRLEKESIGFTPLQSARAEALAIDNSHNGGDIPSGRNLRLHVSGDSRTLAGTRLINNAIGRWKKRGGGNCWSYTHAFEKVHRKNWSNVSILASIDSIEQAEKARNNGYAPAIVVSSFDNDKVFKLPGSDIKWIPCPSQTHKEVSCDDCKLCMKSDWLYETNRGIAFAAHGVARNKIKRRLNIINN